MKLRLLAGVATFLALINFSSAVLINLGGPSSFHPLFASIPPASTISFVPANPSAPIPQPSRGQPGVYNISPGFIFTIVQDIDGMPTPITRFQVNANGSITYLPL